MIEGRKQYMSKKVMVIFPGIGYTADKPLLYYAKKIAKENDIEVVEVTYGNLPVNIKDNKNKMAEAFNAAYSQTCESLDKIDFTQYKKVIFVGKSIGSAVAALYDKCHGIGAGHIYLTPVYATLDYMQENSGICFHGLDDPWCTNEIVESTCRNKKITLYKFDKANHSLETDSVQNNIKVLEYVVERMLKFIK